MWWQRHSRGCRSTRCALFKERFPRFQTGCLYDHELGWYWLSSRPYDPTLKRFTQPDPSMQEGVRSYVYAGDDPVDWTDPSGLDAGVIGGAGAGAAAECVISLGIPFFGEADCLLVGVALLVAATAIAQVHPISGSTTESKDKHYGIVLIYRGLGVKNKKGDPATNPGQFRVDEDGVSAYELPFLPADKPFGLGFEVEVHGTKAGSPKALLGVPGCTATFTAPPEGHWSIQCPGRTDLETQGILKAYADNNPDMIIKNPNA